MLGPLHGPPILQNQILGPLQGSAKRQNQILGRCNSLQSVRIRFWAIATVCNPSESDSGPLQGSAKRQNQILGHCNSLQSVRIGFWAVARSAILQNQILKSLPSVNHPVNPLLSPLFIVQFVSLPSLEMGIAGRRARLHLCRAKKPKQPSIYNEKNSYASLLHGLLCRRHACHECQCD